jgi:uncharacterized membrane protein
MKENNNYPNNHNNNYDYYKPEYDMNNMNRKFDNASNSNYSPKKRSTIILPPPHILESYENICEGAAQMIMEMSEMEQQHRHDWEDQCLKTYERTHKMGMMFGVTFAMMLIAAVVYVAQNLSMETASFLAVSGFTFLSVNAFIIARMRHIDRKPRRTFRHDNNHNNNN